jgi:hypothetical protein
VRLPALEATFIRHERRREPITLANDPANYPAGGTRVEERDVDLSIPVGILAEAHGIRFICPQAYMRQGGPVGAHEIQVWFAGSPVPPNVGINSKGETVRWTASGTGLDDLTLQPSILEINPDCGWHGFVTNGDAS